MGLTFQGDNLCVHAIAHNARIYASRTAVVCGAERLTWRELESRTNKVANALLQMGMRKGEKIALFMPNSLQLFELFWGIIKAGGVVVSLNTMLERAALVRLTNASEAIALIVDDSTIESVDVVRDELTAVRKDFFFTTGTPNPNWRGAAAAIDAAVETPTGVHIEPEDSMTIIFTSGTTGVPKGIEHTHRGRQNYPLGFGMGLAIDRYSVAICATPIYASGTWITMLPTMYRGGTVVLLPSFNAKAFLDAVQEERGTHTFLVPTQYIAILQEAIEDWDVASLDALVTSGQPLPVVVHDALIARFPGTRIFEVYGMTEGFATIACPRDIEMGKRGTVGKPVFLDDVRVIDAEGRELPAGETGELVAYGTGMMKGYYNRADLTEAVTWMSPEGRSFMRTGDLGHLDADGFLFVSGRLKDMIKSGGINIYAADLEQVVMTHECVKEVAVVGVPHPKWNETPIAVVLLKPGKEVDETLLRDWVNERLSKYQRLSRVVIRGELPRATYGKVQKQKLRDEFNGLMA